MWFYISYGVILGLSAGISPGPLLAVVVTQSLQYGPREGVKVAFSPLLTDMPIIGIVLLLFYNLPDLNFALGLTSFVGAAFVLLLGVRSLQSRSPETEISMGPPRSYAKGVLVNALSPHPYLFWLLVGAPLMLKAAQQSLGLPILFLISFYVCLIGAKAVLALLVGHSREYISGAVYLWIMRALGLCLIAVSILLLKDGLALTGRP